MTTPELEWEPIDLLLEQGSAAELDAMRRQVASDPMAALELADTVEFVESMRSLKTEASPEFAGKLQDVVLQADRFCRHHYDLPGRRWHLPLVFAAAAAAAFWLLCWLDVDGLLSTPPRRPTVEIAVVGDLPVASRVAELDAPQVTAPQVTAPQVTAPQVTVEAEELEWQHTVRQIQRRLELEGGAHLRDAFARGLEVEDRGLGKWLDPANALTMLKLGHELRDSAALRAQALRAHGALPEVDRRVQLLAAGIASDLAERPLGSGEAGLDANLHDVAWSMRALIGAGSSAERSVALERGGDWLARALPQLHDERLALALSGLVELAAVSGRYFDAVSAHGRRLVDEVLEADDDRWRRRRPALLAGAVDANTLGEAGRVVSRLPAFGVDPDRCTLFRSLVLGRLREQRAGGQDRPEVLAAMSYGFADLLDREHSERDRLTWALQRWKPVRLAPDYATVQQMAWSLSPGTRGFTRMQRELRQLAVQPAPTGVRDQAAFCLCLATSYAGFVDGLVPRARPVRGS